MVRVNYFVFATHEIRLMKQLFIFRVATNGKVAVNLFFSKSRNTPKKKLFLPRLELLSALKGIRSLCLLLNK